MNGTPEFCYFCFQFFNKIKFKNAIIKIKFKMDQKTNTIVSTSTLFMESRKMLKVCRCCLTDVCYKDIFQEYYFSGQKEIYEEMLKETFDIQISYKENIGLNVSRLICDECVVKLRYAYNFKKTVRQSENYFKLYLEELERTQNQDNTVPNEFEAEFIKTENEAATDMMMIHHQNIFTNGFQDDASFDDDDEILANVKLELTRDENILKKPLKRRRKLPRERKTKKLRKLQEDANNTGTFKTEEKIEKDWLKISERRGNGPLLRENSLKLLANSTICVFQWNKSQYRCFCCLEPFSDMNSLREHTGTKHTLENIEKKIILQQNRLVKVEITHLFCKLCGNTVENLYSLKRHLSDRHEIRFESDEDLLVPFKIGNSELKCQICSEVFNTFRLLNIHMNRHYQKQVCHICGAGFSNLVFLNLHKTRSHRPFHCKQCDLTFTNKIDKKDHDVTVHNYKTERKLRFPCPYCQERYFQEHLRVQHLVEKHGMTRPEHKCQICPKVFLTRSLCNNHVKNVHMKEKNRECEVCHRLFYTKSDVARHRVTHTGVKEFPCTLCSNMFSTKDSLRRHLKRTHGGMS